MREKGEEQKSDQLSDPAFVLPVYVLLQEAVDHGKRIARRAGTNIT
jgi:hypothetical protein